MNWLINSGSGISSLRNLRFLSARGERLPTSRSATAEPIPRAHQNTKTRVRSRTGSQAFHFEQILLGLEPILVIPRNRMELCLPATRIITATTIQPRLVPKGILDHSTTQNNIDLVLLGLIQDIYEPHSRFDISQWTAWHCAFVYQFGSLGKGNS
jgi:hypothetical protein